MNPHETQRRIIVTGLPGSGRSTFAHGSVVAEKGHDRGSR